MNKALYTFFFQLFTTISFVLSSFLIGFTQQTTLATPQDTGKKVIEIRNADLLASGTQKGQRVQRLIGRVVLHHAGADMFCDSAYVYEASNSFDAFGRIHIRQGDTLSLYGDSLTYSGNTKIADVYGRVRLIDPTVQISTNRLTYNRNDGIAYYQTNGTTLTKNDKLTSQKGYYFTQSKEFAFRGNVVIENPEYTLFSDTLIQNTDTDVAYFKGPSRIVSKESVIVCENGWYDKRNDKCQFNKNAVVTSKQHILKGDSLYYERKNGYGKALGNVSVYDTTEKVMILGQFAETFQNIDQYYATDSAQMIQYFEQDTLFLHADTLYAKRDSLEQKIVQAYFHVKFFKRDMQGKCDSLTYHEGDSLLRMFRKPVLWNENNQITADSLRIKMHKGTIYNLYMRQNCMIISEEDTTMYNQISGVNMNGYFTENALSKVDVFDKGKTIYFPKDDQDGAIIGLNEATSKDLTIYIANKQVDKIIFKVQPKGTMHPIEKINPAQFKLEGFAWWIALRPISPESIFFWP